MDFMVKKLKNIDESLDKQKIKNIQLNHAISNDQLWKSEDKNEDFMQILKQIFIRKHET